MNIIKTTWGGFLFLQLFLSTNINKKYFMHTNEDLKSIWQENGKKS